MSDLWRTSSPTDDLYELLTGIPRYTVVKVFLHDDCREYIFKGDVTDRITAGKINYDINGKKVLINRNNVSMIEMEIKS